jgi:alkylation response protein AidB-like acyl-CoA dehydrogenase
MVDREKQIAEAKEMFDNGRDAVGFAAGLFFGRYQNRQLLPYPDLLANHDVNHAVEQVRRFCRDEIDPAKIDRDADIPRDVIDGLGKLGVLGMTLPKAQGGQGFSQVSYCRVLEVIGARCASTAVFVNAHQSIGVRALALYGTPAQQAHWLPKLVTGEWLAAFALTEPNAGSDAGNVQTQAKPTEDGKAYVLNGEKRYITNAAIAQVLTVMARTPVPGSDKTKVTAFLVTPDMKGFEITEARMPKCGIRGTATGRMKFTDMYVPAENVLGKLGRGLQAALNVLNFGRTTFGATCTGVAKLCAEKAAQHANTRVQFEETLGSFELVKEKLAYMGSMSYAMEAATYQTAALIDSGEDDYKLETAILKVFTTDVLWKIINDTIQIFGGQAYFNNEPYERMMRDARINMIGEGANDVLRSFIALVGMGVVGEQFEAVLKAFEMPIYNFGKLRKFAGQRLGLRLRSPEPTVKNDQLLNAAVAVGQSVRAFGLAVEQLLRIHQKGIVERQYLQGRIADAAIELYVSGCVLSRLDGALSNRHLDARQRKSELTLGLCYLKGARRRIKRALADLWDHDDADTTAAANLLLGK